MTECMLVKKKLRTVRDAALYVRVPCPALDGGVNVRVRYDVLRRFFQAHPDAYAWYERTEPDMFRERAKVVIVGFSAMTPALRESLMDADIE